MGMETPARGESNNKEAMRLKLDRDSGNVGVSWKENADRNHGEESGMNIAAIPDDDTIDGSKST